MAFKLFRLPPKLPVTARRTFGLYRPPSAIAERPATCAEVDCRHWREGWITRIPNASGDNKDLLDHVRRNSGRTFTDITALDDGDTRVLLFGPGQTCFDAAAHRTRCDFEPLYVVRDGDYRGNPTGYTQTHSRADHWVEHFGGHWDRLRTAYERG